jgi:hypothetical protein
MNVKETLNQTTHRRSRSTALLLLPVLLAVASGCARRANLTPAATPEDVGPESAVSNVEGVRVRVESDAWPARSRISLHVTPLRIRLTNQGERSVRVDYSDFSLVAADGTRYGALPPYRVEGTVSEPVLAEAYAALDDPSFTYRDFVVAPYYAPIYPRLAVYPGSYFYDPVYVDRYYRYWATTAPPTPEMLARALPAGVLEPGGEVEGFLYFERVDPEHAAVVFRADLTSISDGERFGEIRIPFDVTPESYPG